MAAITKHLNQSLLRLKVRVKSVQFLILSKCLMSVTVKYNNFTKLATYPMLYDESKNYLDFQL